MAQASRKLVPISRGLGSLPIRTYATFPTADEQLPSSIPEVPFSYVATGTRQDTSSGFKHLARFPDTKPWRGTREVPSPKLGSIPGSTGRTPLDSEVGNLIEDGSKRINPAIHSQNVVEFQTDDELSHESSKTNGRDLAPSSNFNTGPELAGRRRDWETYKSVSSAPIRQIMSEATSQNQVEQLLRNAAGRSLVRNVGFRGLPFKKVNTLRIRKFSMEFSDQHVHAQAFSTSSPRPNPTSSEPLAPEPISIDQFHQLADHYIDGLVSRLEELQEGRRDVDCEYSAGVLNLDFPPAGTYVFNKQPPNKQIWLSSPISGPKRYDYVLTSPSAPETADDMTGGDGAARSGVGVHGGERKGDWIYLRDGTTLTRLLKEELGVDMDEEG
ncbi:MAG: hypothetical protein Q9176_006782 [Flavoplaca citrina]